MTKRITTVFVIEIDLHRYASIAQALGNKYLHFSGYGPGYVAQKSP